MIRSCADEEPGAILAIINEAAGVYRGVIPAECWHEPYMSEEEFARELAAGVEFWGLEDEGTLCGVMGLQRVRDVHLIRHAYVLPAYQGRGVGAQLLADISKRITGSLLVGTWAAAKWAIRFYERHGFAMVPPPEKTRLLRTYWSIPNEQEVSSVVLARKEIA